MNEIDVKVMLAGCNRAVLEMFQSSGFYASLPADFIFVTVEDAMIRMKQTIRK